jgi:hypothetical protein
VEDRGAITSDAFAEILARQVERANAEFPLAGRAPQIVARVAAARDLAAFRAAGGRGRVHSDTAATFLIDTTTSHEPPAFLPRAIGVRSVGSPEEAAAYCKQHRLPIEAVAIAGMRDDLADLAIELGAARIARFGELQAPLAAGRHGGRPRIAEFVRWMTDER